MQRVQLRQNHNFVTSLTNEFGNIIKIRIHSFRGLSFMSVFVNDVLEVASEPCILETEFGTKTIRTRHGALVWVSPYANREYPSVETYEDAHQLWYVEPSEMAKMTGEQTNVI